MSSLTSSSPPPEEREKKKTKLSTQTGIIKPDKPNGPTLRANPFPKVTDLFCRIPLPTLFYRLEAIHLEDLLRL